MQKRFKPIWLIPVFILLGVGIFFLLPVYYNKVLPRLEIWFLEDLKYRLQSPGQAVYQPEQQSQVDLAVTQMMQTHQATLTLEPITTSTPTPGPTLTPTITPTPLPATVKWTDFRYEDQHNRWNYCGPANLSMALNFWGWDGNRDTVAKVVKPGVQDPKLDFIQQGRWDYNVMPYEMVDFVNEETEFGALYRLGGNVDLIKTMLAAGFPVIAEKGYYEKDYTGRTAWMGHYQFVTGYDDVSKGLIVQDTWNDGPNFRISYDDFMAGEAWLSFDYLFIVVYPLERESEVLDLLGPYADPRWAAQYALGVAEDHISKTNDINSFFAWFAKGTNHVALQEYADAANAYDQAFAIYNSIGKQDILRPYRMMWFQTGPYWAYFYTGRYQDVIKLADVTLTETISKPTLEESIYWRGQAKYMVGDTAGAIADYREALRLHPNWSPAIQALQDLGVQP